MATYTRLRMILISLILATGLMGQNPIPSYNVPVFHRANFQEGVSKNSHGDITRGKRLIKTRMIGSSVTPPCYGWIWIYSLDLLDVFGPFYLECGDTLAQEVDEREWGVYIESECHVTADVWFDPLRIGITGIEEPMRIKAMSLQNIIPNAGFEQWDVTPGWIWMPQSWRTNNIPDFGFVNRNSDAYEGLYSAWIGPGGLCEINIVTSVHPMSLEAYVQTKFWGADTLDVKLFLYQDGITIDSGFWRCSEPLEEWTRIEVPVSTSVMTI